MADLFKNIFSRKKTDKRFKAAGPGHKLNEASAPKPASNTKKKDVYNPPVRSGLTDESKQAASAALARLEGKKPDAPGFNTSLAAIRAQVKREVEAEKSAKATSSTSEEKSAEEPAPSAGLSENLAVTGVFFRCPLIGDEVLPQQEWQDRIREFLKEQLESDPALAAVLMVHSLNKNKEKVQLCIDTLSKYFENILQQPSEEKYRRIRKTNKIYLERVAPMEGASLVLEGAGFKPDGDFYVFPEDAVSDDALQNLEMLVDALKCAEPITLQVDRNLQVLMPSQAKCRRELPRDFFKLSPEELKREHQAKVEAIEKSSMLMTKAMREKEELRELRNYKYCLIRVRFPDGIMLQGTFGVYESFTAVFEFLQESLTDPEGTFTLSTPFGEKLEKTEERSLIDLKLVPATILIFHAEGDNHLSSEVIVLCQEIGGGD